METQIWIKVRSIHDYCLSPAPFLIAVLKDKIISLFFKGLKTTQDAKFYALSASYDKFSNEGKTLVVQFTVKHEQKIDCGGGYVKVREREVLYHYILKDGSSWLY